MPQLALFASVLLLLVSLMNARPAAAQTTAAAVKWQNPNSYSSQPVSSFTTNAPAVFDAVPGDTTTGYSGNGTLCVLWDMGSPVSLSRVTARFVTNYEYSAYYSSDGTNWTEWGQAYGSATAADASVPVTARYVQFLLMGSGTVTLTDTRLYDANGALVSGPQFPPDAPTALSATATSGQVAWVWTPPTGTGLTYSIFEGTTPGGESATPLATGLASAHYTATGLTNGMTYYVTVKATSSLGTSAPSPEACAIPSPSAQTARAVQYQIAGGYYQPASSFTQNAPAMDDGAVGDRSTGYDGGSGTVNVLWDMGSAQSIGGYQAQFGAAPFSGAGYSNDGINWTDLPAPVSGSKQTFPAVLARYVQFYQYEGAMTDFRLYSGSGALILGPGQTPPVTLPAPPTGFWASGGGNQVALNWAADPGAASYNLYRGNAPGAEAAMPLQTGLTGTSFTDTSGTPGTTYSYRLTGVNAAGESGPSAESSDDPAGSVGAGSGAMPLPTNGGAAPSAHGGYWLVSYSEDQTESYLVPDYFQPWLTTPQTYSWYTNPDIFPSWKTSPGNDWYESGNLGLSATDTVIATLTWTPGYGQTLASDPPPKTLALVETAHSWWQAHWNGTGFASDAGSASDGLDDPEVFVIPWNTNGGLGTSSGSHSIHVDSSSGVVKVPCTLSARNPASSWITVQNPNDPLNPLDMVSLWDWYFDSFEYGFSVAQDTRAVTISCPAVDTYADGGSKYRFPALTGPVITNVRQADGTLRGDTVLNNDVNPDQIAGTSQIFTYSANMAGVWATSQSTYHWYSSFTGYSYAGDWPDFNADAFPYMEAFTVPVAYMNTGFPVTTNAGATDQVFLSMYDGQDKAEAANKYFMHFHNEWEPTAWPPDGPAHTVSPIPDPEVPSWETYPWKLYDPALPIYYNDLAGDDVTITPKGFKDVDGGVDLGKDPVVLNFGFSYQPEDEPVQTKHLIATPPVPLGYMTWPVYRPLVNRTKGHLDHYGLHGYIKGNYVWREDEQVGYEIRLYDYQPVGTAVTAPPPNWNP